MLNLPHPYIASTIVATFRYNNWKEERMMILRENKANNTCMDAFNSKPQSEPQLLKASKPHCSNQLSAVEEIRWLHLVLSANNRTFDSLAKDGKS